LDFPVHARMWEFSLSGANESPHFEHFSMTRQRLSSCARES
jgi:hypothetical protein